MMKKAPGRTFLMIVGIFLAVGGVFHSTSFAMNWMIMGKEEFAPVLQQALQEMGMSKLTYQVSLAFLTVQAIIDMVAGMIGIVNSNKIEKATLCYRCGLVLIVYSFIYNIYSAFVGVFSISSVIFSLILPLLYYWGALKNRQALKNQQN